MLGGLAAHLPTTHQVQPVQQELNGTTMSIEAAGGGGARSASMESVMSCLA